MVSLQDLQRPPISIILKAALLLEIYLIYAFFSDGFSEYLTFVLVLLAAPAAYFAFNFLRARFQRVRTYQAIARDGMPRDASEETRIQVEKLLASQAYQEYERKRQAKAKKRLAGESIQQQEKEEGQNEAGVEQVARELQQMEEEIFDI